MCADQTDKILTIEAADETAEISVLNGRFERVARGIGTLKQTLPTGVYKISVRVGPVLTDQLVSLDQDRQLSIAPLDIPSSAPLATSSNSNDSQRAAAINASSDTRDTFGHGASVFIFIRPANVEEGGSSANLAAGLSFLDENGALLCKLEERTTAQVGGNCAAWRADVAPGAYRVRLELPDGPSFERALVTTPGTQTQLFLLERDYGLPGAQPQRGADLAAGTTFTSFSDKFDPGDRHARLTELACYALTQTRRILSDALIKRLLDEKFDNPMLGLLAAHLVLRDHPGDTRLFEIVTDNVRRLLGEDHPDVQALWLRRSNRGDMKEIHVRTPPMLRRSWELAAEESIRETDVIPSETPSGKIAFKVLPTGPWLLWRGDTEDQMSLETAEHDLTAATRALGDYLKTRARVQAGHIPVLGAMQRLGRAVRSLPGLSSFIGPPPKVEQVSGKLADVKLSEDEKTEIARLLGVPGNAIDQVVKRFSR